MTDHLFLLWEKKKKKKKKNIIINTFICFLLNSVKCVQHYFKITLSILSCYWTEAEFDLSSSTSVIIELNFFSPLAAFLIIMYLHLPPINTFFFSKPADSIFLKIATFKTWANFHLTIRWKVTAVRQNKKKTHRANRSIYHMKTSPCCGNIHVCQTPNPW